MNCKNCGANYQSKELNCPYCGSANAKGESWFARRQAAREEHESNLRKYGATVKMITYDRIINRIIIGVIAFLVCYFVGLIGFFSVSIGAAKTSSEIKMDQLYEEERFGEMHALMREKDLFGKNNYECSQMALIYSDYEKFLIRRLFFFDEMDAEISENSASALINHMHRVMSWHAATYPDLTKKNREQLEEYKLEVADFAENMFGFTEKEMGILAKDYLLTDEQDALETLLIEGRTSQ